MKVILIVVLVAHLCFAVCFREWFTTPTFPPSGWSIVNEGPGSGNWNWSNSGQPGNGYAHGGVSVSGSSSTSAASTLKTYSFSLYAGDTCHVDFLMKGTSSGFAAGFGWQAILFNGTSVIATSDLTPTWYWWNQSVTFQSITTASANYKIGWKVYAGCSPSGGSGDATFDLDSVHVYDESVNIEPTSLGRIKGAFH